MLGEWKKRPCQPGRRSMTSMLFISINGKSLLLRPWIVGSYSPKIAFRIPASVAAAAIAFVLNFPHDLCPAHFGFGVMSIRVGDNNVDGMRNTACLGGLPHMTPKFVVGDRS